MKQIVIGRSGYGKTSYVIEKIKEDLKAGYENIIVIVPDQFTFETEREIIKETGIGLFEIRVLSFRRLISALRDELGTKGCFEMDETNKAMFVNKLLYDYDNELTIYKGAYRTPSFSFDMSKSITECKQFGASFEDLQNLELHGKTQEKIHDIAEIYKAYTQFKDSFKDNEDIINIINDRIPNSQLLKNARIYIDHFDVFTFQGYNTIEQMAKICSSLCVCLCTDGSKKGLFALTTETMQKIQERIADIEILKLDKPFKNNNISYLEQNLFDQSNKTATASDGSVELFSFSTALAEIDHAMAKIIELKNSGYNYQDISLMVGDIEEYSKPVEQCMIDCGIPYFIDKKIPLMSSRISKFLVYSLKSCLVFEDGPLINMLKQGIMLKDKEDIQTFENYILKHGIRNALSPIKNNEQMEALRKNVSISKLKSAIQKSKTTKEMAQAARDYLYSFEIPFDDELDERSFNKIIEILERMEYIFGDSEIDLSLFISILETGLSSVTLGIIPDKRDCVVIGDISRTKIQRAKCLLVLGIGDGVIPKITQKTGLLSDYDSTAISNHIKIGRDSFDLNNLEQLLTYKMFSKPTDYLYLSHSDRGIYGTKRENKILFPKIQKLLYGLIVNMDVPFNEEMALRLLKNKNLAFKSLMASVYAGENNYITKGAYYYFEKHTNLQNLFKPKEYNLHITASQVKDVYSSTIISASRIESYYKCAFMQFIKYGIRPKKRELYKIEKLDTGILLHSIIDKFSKYIIKETENYKNNNADLNELYDRLKCGITDSSMIDDIVKNRIEEDGLSIYSKDNIGKVMAKRITDISKNALIGVLNELKSSDFVMTYSEQDLRNLGTYKLDNVTLDGRIDRVDISSNGIRIVDYKQGGKKLNPSDVYAGVQLQLLLYMEAVIAHYRAKQNKELLPLEIGYYKIATEYESADSLASLEKITPKNASSTLKPNKGKNKISENDMQKITGFGMDMAKQAISRIYSGDIAINPYLISGDSKSSPCEYCDFKDICKNDNMENKRIIKKVKWEDLTGEDSNME